ncbi:MAG: SPFH domain-containing protein [Paramuribaculum sp.]|nr:SPFH domain-containing protein [Paramuribaculum sp.]
MTTSNSTIATNQYPFHGKVVSGFAMLGLLCVFLLAAWIAPLALWASSDPEVAAAIIAPCTLIFTIMCIGFFTQQPNQARVMIWFGSYRGTFDKTGFFWVNPFMSRRKMSLRIRNMDIAPIKVNDKIGNPVMIGMVLVWKVRDTYRAVFDIDAPADEVVGKDNLKVIDGKDRALNSFVRIQSDAALREVTGHYAYDNETADSASEEITLRSGGHEINERLEEKINERLAMAGIEVVEARINYLAYAPEIAAVMLRRQQASAVIAAREKIVEGAVSMVKMALDDLEKQGVVRLDGERRAAMVSNLLVVLCADEPAQPVINTGTLYN